MSWLVAVCTSVFLDALDLEMNAGSVLIAMSTSVSLAALVPEMNALALAMPHLLVLACMSFGTLHSCVMPLSSHCVLGTPFCWSDWTISVHINTWSL